MTDRRDDDAWARLTELNSRAFDRRRDLRKASARGAGGGWWNSPGDWLAVFQATPAMLLIGDNQGKLLETNTAGLDLLGQKRDVIKTLSVVDVVAARQEWTLAEFERFLRNGAWKGELELRRSDGQSIEAQVVARAAGAGPDGFIAVVYERARRTDDPANDASATAIEQVVEAREPLKDIASLASTETGDGLLLEALSLERRLGQLIEFRSLRSPELRLSPTSVDLADVLALAVSEAQSHASNHHIGLFTPRGTLIGHWDVLSLSRLVHTLLFESVLAAPPGGAIRIMATDLAGDVLVSLTAEPGGIQPAVMGRVLSPAYERSKSSASLSLAICQRIVELHGGRLWFESAGAEGSALHFTLRREPGEIAKGA